MTVDQIPVVNAGAYYLSGLRLSNNATTPNTQLDIASGAARDSTNVNDIILSSAVTLNAATTGANALDTGVLVLNTFYAVFVIGDSSSYNATATLLSLSATSPRLPAGYDMFRRIGYVLTDASVHLLAFDQRDKGSDRAMWYRASIATDITAGTSSTFAAVNVSASIPQVSCTGIFKVTFTPTGANDELALRSGDSATDEGQAVANGVAAGVVTVNMLTCPVGATLASGVDYKIVAGTAAINVQGYVDQLGL